MNPLADFEMFCPSQLKIKTERGEIVPFRFNSAQKKVIQIIKDQFEVDRITIDLVLRVNFILRLIILKARQQGISTLVQALIFWVLYLLENQKALTLGHKTDASNNLFDMYSRYYKYLHKDLKRALKKNNEKKIQYLKTESENKVDTAGAGEIARSDTLQWVHATEVAFYPDQKVTFVGLMQGAKNAKGHFVESTAKGYNAFREKWVDAVAGRGGYTPIFLSWLDFPEYIEEALLVGHIKELDEEELKYFMRDIGNIWYNSYEGEEQMLLDKYGATINQLQWRRFIIDDTCEKDVDQFHQEYPRDPEEAFISSGNPVFPQGKVQANFASSKEPIKVGDLIYKYAEHNGEREITGVEFVENARGFIKIFTEPEAVDGMYRFCGGDDVAEGLEQGDFSTIDVMDRYSNELHLSWHGHIDADLLGEEIHKVWLYLNKDCYFAIEKNNHGLTTLTKAFGLGVPLYSKQSFGKGYEQRNGSDFGHTTSTKSKKYLVDTMIEWIRDDLFTDHDKDFWKECMIFVRNARGQCQAEGKDKDPKIKNYDDRVISRGLMMICHLWMPSFTKRVKREPVARSFVRDKKKPVGLTKF